MPVFGIDETQNRTRPADGGGAMSAPAGGITPAQVNPSGIPGQAPAKAPEQAADHGGPRLGHFNMGMSEGLPGMPEAGAAAGGAEGAAGIGELAELAPLALA